MENLPKDLPDQNNPWPTHPADPSTPPPAPPSNMVDPVQSWVAKHEARDAHGHFIKADHLAPNQPANNPPESNHFVAPENPTGLPPIIEINQNTKPTDKKDPPLFGFFLTNPVTYLKAFLTRLIKRQAITIRIPVLAILMLMIGIGGFGIGFQSGINWALFKVFPNYSPILHREITEQGIIQKSNKGYFLQTNDKNGTIWTLESASANVKLEDYVNQNVQVKGNLTSTPNLIQVSEIIIFNQTAP